MAHKKHSINVHVIVIMEEGPVLKMQLMPRVSQSCPHRNPSAQKKKRHSLKKSYTLRRTSPTASSLKDSESIALQRNRRKVLKGASAHRNRRIRPGKGPRRCREHGRHSGCFVSMSSEGEEKMCLEKTGQTLNRRVSFKGRN